MPFVVPNFVIRDYHPEDFETLWRLDQDCFAPGISYSRPELKFFIRRRGAFTLVAEAEAQSSGGGTSEKAATESGCSEIAGFLVAQTGRTGHIITIDVAPQARRSGVGSQLMQAAEDRLQVAGSAAAGLETAVDNLAALAFYKRRGYNVIETIPRYYSSGVDALRMRKELISAGS